MDELQRVRRTLVRLPIFPLPGAVLLPHAVVPLHIFEPRYRKMVRDCLDGLGVLALANIPDERAAALRPPRVLPVVGAGVLVRSDPLPDGRFNIVVRGVLRARIAEELPTHEPYRLVRADELAAEEEGDPSELRQLAFALAQANRELSELAPLAAKAQGAGDLADLVAGAVFANPRERQAVLEAADLETRVALATEGALAALARTASRERSLN